MIGYVIFKIRRKSDNKYVYGGKFSVKWTDTPRVGREWPTAAKANQRAKELIDSAKRYGSTVDFEIVPFNCEEIVDDRVAKT